MTWTAPTSVCLAFALSACRPSFDERESLVTGPRILAVRADPPESELGESVSYQALVVTPDGVAEGAQVHWAFCAAPKPLTENASVNTVCLENAVRPVDGSSAEVTAATPTDACQLFGPNTPPGDFRPRDPDDTGGFYQPVRVVALGVTAFALERMRCNLPNAPLDVAVAFDKQYVRNHNPKLLPLRAYVGAESVALDALPTGRNIRFYVEWRANSAEMFVAFDPKTHTLVHRREALRVFWYATGGMFDSDVTGRSADEMEATASNTWTAPDELGSVSLWVVVRDSRGGLDFATYTAHVK